tara:strand:+ start:43 stop:153 length:111 start_codon:yes stop_codon:yes gene_type:complete
MTIPDVISKIDLFWQRRSVAAKWAIAISVGIILFIM